MGPTQTAFELRVLQAARAIPPGTWVSYADISDLDP